MHCTSKDRTRATAVSNDALFVSIWHDYLTLTQKKILSRPEVPPSFWPFPPFDCSSTIFSSDVSPTGCSSDASPGMPFKAEGFAKSPGTSSKPSGGSTCHWMIIGTYGASGKTEMKSEIGHTIETVFHANAWLCVGTRFPVIGLKCLSTAFAMASSLRLSSLSNENMICLNPALICFSLYLLPSSTCD